MKQHSPRFLTLVAESKSRINEITPQILKNIIVQNQACFLVDVREDHEWLSGHIPNAIHIGKGVIERDIEKQIPDHDAKIVVYCSGGFRCALVADSLQKMGYTNVHSLSSGMQGWIDSGYGIDQ